MVGRGDQWARFISNDYVFLLDSPDSNHGKWSCSNVCCVKKIFIIIAMGLFSFLFGACSKQQPPSPPPSSNANAKADAEKLLDSLMPFAKKMLQERHEFFPFGGKMTHDGKIVCDAAYDGREQPPSQALIDLLRQAHQAEARAQKIRVCAIIYDIRTIPPGRTQKQDAIAAAIDHASGYSVVVVFPYAFDVQKNLQVDSPFAVDGAHDIFPRPQQPMN
jgi:hypothetical protein